MTFIKYVDNEQIKKRDKVQDDDHIIKNHSVNSRAMKNHFDLYVT